MKKKSTENVVHAYLSSKFAHKRGSIVILSDDGTELKNAVVTDACEHLDIKNLYSAVFRPQGSSRIENVHNFLKKTLSF